jgi:hypothetical protein
MAMVRIWIAEHHRSAVDIKVDVHRPALVIYRMTGDLLSAEGALIKSRGPARPVNL